MSGKSTYPDASQATYLTYKAATVQEMADWLNKVQGAYKWCAEPMLTPDLCRCIIKVWETE